MRLLHTANFMNILDTATTQVAFKMGLGHYELNPFITKLYENFGGITFFLKPTIICGLLIWYHYKLHNPYPHPIYKYGMAFNILFFLTCTIITLTSIIKTGGNFL